MESGGTPVEDAAPRRWETQLTALLVGFGCLLGCSSSSDPETAPPGGGHEVPGAAGATAGSAANQGGSG